MNEHKAIFLDRDGVINKERRDYVKSINELEIFPYVSNAIKLLNDAGFLTVVITNQSAINRGIISHDDVKNIHENINQHLNMNKTKIDAFYYCPHTPFENCQCRKPKPGLLLKAASELNIDLSKSFMIGNSDSDLEAARSAKCKSIKVSEEYTLYTAVVELLENLNKIN